MNEQEIQQSEAEIAQKAADIQARIAQLQGLDKVDLKGEMVELKKALMDNPAACLLLLPEDIGALVDATRKIVGLEITKAASKPKKGSSDKNKPLSAAQINDILSKVSDDDL